MTRDTWKAYCKGTISYKEYYSLAKKHIGWSYSYKGVNVHCLSASKEQAFDLAIDKLRERFGLFGVIEDDMMFNPIFK